MKKLILLIIAAFSFTFALSAQEAQGNPENAFEWEMMGDGTAYTGDGEEAAADASSDSEAEDLGNGPKRIPNRGFELGLLNGTFGVSNSLLTLDQLFQKKVILDLEELSNGFRVDINMDLVPLYFFINHKDQWGFGLDIGKVSVYGNLDVAGSLLAPLGKTDKDGDEFGAGAAVFVDIGVPFFFHLNKLNGFKINARPAFYAPALYLEPGVKYTHTTNSKGAIIAVDWDMQVFSMLNFDTMEPNFSSFAVGFDFSAGAEYPLFDWLDVGVNITNMPFVPGSLNEYVRIKGKMKVDTSKLAVDKLLGGAGEEPVEGEEDGEEGSVFDDIYELETEDIVYGSKNQLILRPFKLVAYANYRPFEEVPFTVIGQFGFMLNGLYAQPFSLEIGATARYDVGNLFIPSIGINYEDRMWKNSFDFILNLRAFEFDFGIALQSADFAKSWGGAGLAAHIDLKFGW